MRTIRIDLTKKAAGQCIVACTGFQLFAGMPESVTSSKCGSTISLRARHVTQNAAAERTESRSDERE
jgi:hypothetical protein